MGLVMHCRAHMHRMGLHALRARAADKCAAIISVRVTNRSLYHDPPREITASKSDVHKLVEHRVRFYVGRTHSQMRKCHFRMHFVPHFLL